MKKNKINYKKEYKELVKDNKRYEEIIDEKSYKITNLEDKIEGIHRDDRLGLMREINDIKDEKKNLLEIIRWLVNKDTAQYPFESEKSQRSQKDPGFS